LNFIEHRIHFTLEVLKRSFVLQNRERLLLQFRDILLYIVGFSTREVLQSCETVLEAFPPSF